jgi:3-dehydroquinate synthetase
MQLDKKAREGAVRFALPQAIGRMHAEGNSWTVAASEAVVRDVLGGHDRGR